MELQKHICFAICLLIAPPTIRVVGFCFVVGVNGTPSVSGSPPTAMQGAGPGPAIPTLKRFFFESRATEQEEYAIHD